MIANSTSFLLQTSGKTLKRRRYNIDGGSHCAVVTFRVVSVEAVLSRFGEKIGVAFGVTFPNNTKLYVDEIINAAPVTAAARNRVEAVSSLEHVYVLHYVGCCPPQPFRRYIVHFSSFPRDPARKKRKEKKKTGCRLDHTYTLTDKPCLSFVAVNVKRQ